MQNQTNVQAIIKDRFDQTWDQIKAGGFAANIFPEESKIRLEQKILDGKGQYIFNLKDQSADGLTTINLERNDVFVINRIGVLLNLVTKTDNGQEVDHLYSFPAIKGEDEESIHKFGFTDDQIESLYHGYLQWTMDNNVVLSAYPMEKFRLVPQQQGAFVLASDDTAVNEQILGEWNVDEAMRLMMPRYVVAGTHDHKLIVNFPAAGKTFTTTEGCEARLVLMLDGFLVKSGCEYKGGTGTNPFGDAVGQW